MKKIILGIIIILIVGIFFGLPIIPSYKVPKTPEQKAFCEKGLCGGASDLTPYQFVKWYLKYLTN